MNSKEEKNSREILRRCAPQEGGARSRMDAAGRILQFDGKTDP
jgi:hypothetical protein